MATKQVFYTAPANTINAGALKAAGALAGVLLLLITSWTATQYLANSFAYQDALGAPLFTVGQTRFYQPAAWASWYFKWRTYQNATVQHSFNVSYFIIAIGCLISFCCFAYVRYRGTKNLQKPVENLHGSAHFMSREDVLKHSGLIGTGAGVYVGAYQDPTDGKVHYLRHDGPEHILAFAPTRSGKGVGLVLPTLLSWPHSVVVHDIKGEAWAITAGWRQHEANNLVLKLEPTAMDGSSAKFNPLDEIRLRTQREVSDAQNITNMIVDPDGKGLNDHWAKTGHALLVGTMLHVLYSEPNKTLEGVASFLSDPRRDIEQTLQMMLTAEHDTTGDRGWVDADGKPTRTHQVVAASARDMLNKSPNEMSGVLSTAMSFLTLYRDPVVAENTSRSDFCIRDLMNADKPISLYLVVSPSDKDRLKPFVRLVINQIVRTLTEHMDFKDGRSIAHYKHRLLMLLDEFPGLGKLDILEEALAFVAGYGIKMYLITQDKSQLDKHYGKDESIFSNCHVRVAYAPNKIETAKMLSEMLGKATAYKQSISISGGRMKPMLDNMSTQIQESQRELMTPDEVMRLRGPVKDSSGNIVDAGDMLIFLAGYAPIMGTQILYFRDPTFNQRSKIHAPKQSDRLSHFGGTGQANRPAPIAPARPTLTPEEQAAAAPIVFDRDPDEKHFYTSVELTDEALIPDDPDEWAADSVQHLDPAVYAGTQDTDDDSMVLGAPMPEYHGEALPDDEDDEPVAPVEPVAVPARKPRVRKPAAKAAKEEGSTTKSKPKPKAKPTKATAAGQGSAPATAAPPSLPVGANDPLLMAAIAAAAGAATTLDTDTSMFG
jgi:type IV secretion system protein VirD4